VKELRGWFAAWPVWAWSVVIFIVVLVLQPVQIGILFWGLLKITLASIVAYWLDRVFFPYARPGLDPTSLHELLWMLRRVLFMGFVLWAMGANL
jgi:hypothetical protein